MIEGKYLNTGDGHELYYEAHGDPRNPSILFVHGGPGAGFSEHDKEPFDFENQHVIFFEQRGAGRSKPFASLEANTTDHLVADMNQLLDHLGVERCSLYGGSWGSTLALVYAIRNPERVEGMILRGIFLSTKEEYQHIFVDGTDRFFPEALEGLYARVPKDRHHDVLNYYSEQIRSGDPEKAEQYSRAYATFELSVAKLELPTSEIPKYLEEFNYKSLAAIECHYLSQNCFLEENYIWNNLEVIRSKPTAISHGRYDMLCMPKLAYRLAKEFRNCRLEFATAGHSATDEALKESLAKATKWVLEQVKD